MLLELGALVIGILVGATIVWLISGIKYAYPKKLTYEEGVLAGRNEVRPLDIKVFSQLNTLGGKSILGDSDGIGVIIGTVSNVTIDDESIVFTLKGVEDSTRDVTQFYDSWTVEYPLSMYNLFWADCGTTVVFSSSVTPIWGEVHLSV